MDTKIEKLLKELTLTEKAGLCSGLDFWHTKPVERLGIPSVMMTDGPHGVRKERDDVSEIALKESYLSTCFPTAATTACSWDPQLLHQMGEALGEECKDQGVVTLLGPGVNIKRSALCGRNFEYFSEDPLLAGKLGAAFINGVQSKGVGTSLKHYAANNQEYLRMSISSVVDERALREIYLRPFEICVKEAQPATVMASYNRIDGIYSCENHRLLTEILRDEWGFKGIVVSDWGATNDRVEGIRAGLDLEMPFSGGPNDAQIVSAVESGALSMELLDATVARILSYVFAMEANRDEKYTADYAAHHALARKIAADCSVLLKNDDDILPLAEGSPVTVIGEMARTLRYQGAGSSRINCKNLVSFLQHLDAVDCKYDFCSGYGMQNDGCDAQLLAEATEKAKGKERVLLFVGLTDSYESEGYDRRHFSIPKGQLDLIDAVTAVNPNVIVVISGGSPFDMNWIDKPKAILNAYLQGEAFGEAIYDVLFGKVNPSGKLAETWGLDTKDNMADLYFRGGPVSVEYRESVFVGYRYYDTAKKAVRFPFGYGLSYTKFECSDVELESNTYAEGDEIKVSVTVTNTGNCFGKETVQFYAHDTDTTIYKPTKQLAGFVKVALEAGESRRVTVTLDNKAFGYYNVNAKAWHVESGEYEVFVGTSSRDIKAILKLQIISAADIAVPNYVETAPVYYNMDSVAEISVAQFEAVLGHEVPLNIPLKKGEFTACSTLQDIQHTSIGKLFAKVAPLAIKSQMQNVDQTALLAIQLGLTEIPIRALCGMSNGIVPFVLCEGIVMRANGHFFKGNHLLFKGCVSAVKNLISITKENKKKDAERKAAAEKK